MKSSKQSFKKRQNSDRAYPVEAVTNIEATAITSCAPITPQKKVIAVKRPLLTIAELKSSQNNINIHQRLRDHSSQDTKEPNFHNSYKAGGTKATHHLKTSGTKASLRNPTSLLGVSLVR